MRWERRYTEADKYYELVGLTDAFHEQTILAYESGHKAPPRAKAKLQGALPALSRSACYPTGAAFA